jgi:hypothetical protein
LTTHRLLRATNVGGQWVYVTKGDNQWQPDPPLNEADIVGRVEAVRRGERVWGPNGRFWLWSNWYLTRLMLIQTRLYQLLYPLYRWAPLRFLAALYRRLRLIPWWLLRALTGRHYALRTTHYALFFIHKRITPVGRRHHRLLNGPRSSSAAD